MDPGDLVLCASCGDMFVKDSAWFYHRWSFERSRVVQEIKCPVCKEPFAVDDSDFGRSRCQLYDRDVFMQPPCFA